MTRIEAGAEEGIPSRALVLPSPSTLLPRGWWRDHALPILEEIGDVDALRQDSARLAALRKYVNDRAQRFELEAAQRWCEVRIGELLGEGERGRPAKNTPVGAISGVAEKDRPKFRLLARHKAVVLRILEGKDGGKATASRRRILARIERQRNSAPPTPEHIAVRHGDFREVLADLHGTVDAIITDPPYGHEHVHLYGDLAIHAVRLLRPGGICAIMVGQSYLPEIFELLRIDGLTYRWTLAYLTGGSATAIHGRRLQTYWKPVLIYERPPPNPDHRIGGDVIRSEGGDTDPTHHQWGQNEQGVMALVRRLTEDSQLIVDPFLGGGTTAVACAALNRRFIGCDIDQKAVAAAKERLA